ncbi:MAG: hypothetical protein ACHQ1H_11125 [Nitrososphaerales archaeon]
MPKDTRNLSVIASKIPRSLHQALIRIQAKDDVSYEVACEEAAVLLDQNSKVFDEAINLKANELYKKRYMTELNKARQTISSDGRQASYDLGYKAGYEEGLRVGDDSGFKRAALELAPKAWESGYKEGSFRWKFTCKNCNTPGTLTDYDWKKIINSAGGVVHTNCMAVAGFELIVREYSNSPMIGQAYDDIRAGVRDLLMAVPQETSTSQ